METESVNFTKQYTSNQREILTDLVFKQDTIKDESQYVNINEPIDLTSRNRNVYDNSKQPNLQKKIFNPNLNNNQGTIRFFTHEVPARRHRKRKEFSFDPYLNTLENHFQNSSSKQEEILKAARSLFSKRTRTLYHWMYPNAPKQQIKSAVASSWDSLGMQEKEFYISQVLGRFGFPPCSLMINPQLGGIKELPSLPGTQNLISSSSTELQNAISSISESSNHTESTNNVEYEKLQMKKKKGRPFGSKNKKSKYDVRTVNSHEFNDDPELKKELEQFALFMYDERQK